MTEPGWIGRDPNQSSSSLAAFDVNWLAATSRKPLSEMDLARTVARHATELVDRLLSERNALRALLHDYFPRVAKARVRLRQWQEGDGSRRRDVLADLEDILG